MDLYLIFHSLLRGVYDSFKGATILTHLDKDMNERLRAKLSPSRSMTPIRRRESDLHKQNVPARPLRSHERSKVWIRTLQCCALNGGIFLVSIISFEYGLLPLINSILSTVFGESSLMGKFLWSWMRPLLSFLFEIMWVVPLFIMTKIINALWFQDIADSAFRYSGGRRQSMLSIVKIVADSIFSLLVQTLFLVQAMVVSLIPIYMIGTVFSLVHMSLLYSLYAFEYKWYNLGWGLHRRLTYIENNWPYFIGFGLPLALFTHISSSWVISGCIFSILFPLFIVSANEALPITGSCDIPLHLFSLVIEVSNALLKVTVRDDANKNRPTAPAAVRLTSR